MLSLANLPGIAIQQDQFPGWLSLEGSTGTPREVSCGKTYASTGERFLDRRPRKLQIQVPMGVFEAPPNEEVVVQ
jgi:hypothetical protein